MTVPTRYILALIAFAIAALGFMMLPADARSLSTQPQCMRCSPPPPPPPPPHTPQCHQCQQAHIIVPPPHVPPPNIVVVNAGARAQAQAGAIAIAVATSSGDTIVRNNSVVSGGTQASVTSAAFSVVEGSMEMQSSVRERMALIQSICLDATNNPHPASQTFAGRDVRETYSGEIFRCMSGTHMRVTIEGRTFDCTAGQALWFENSQVTCKTQIARRPCNERSLLRRFGPGDKMVHLRDAESRQVRRETTYNGAMTMDGGVGASVW